MLRLRRRLGVVSVCLALVPCARAATFVVNTTADSGAGTLRQAILDAQAAAGPDSISFAIPGSGVRTLIPTTALPTISTPITIDGYTQPGTPNTLAVGDDAVLTIQVTGNGTTPYAFYVFGGGATGTIIRGLVINGTFVGTAGQAGAAIRIEQANGVTVEGNFIGTDSTGDAASTTTVGVDIVNGSNNLVGGATPAARNIISGNAQAGIQIRTQFIPASVVSGRKTALGSPGSPGVANANAIRGNYVGTDADGLKGLANGIGIHLNFQVTNTIVGGILLQGPGPPPRGEPPGNVVSANAGPGLLIEVSTGTVIQGNYIGTDADGVAALPNSSGGIVLRTSANNNLIGGVVTGVRNVISGNGLFGISIENNSIGNTIQQNFIGANLMFDGSTGGPGNAGPGIILSEGSNDTMIGGPNQPASDPDIGNVIAFNSGQGVAVGVDEGNVGVQRATILSNRIVGNGQLGIDLMAGSVAGVTSNDFQDPDVGPNGLQNFPTITSAVLLGGPVATSGTRGALATRTNVVSFSGTLNSTPSTTFRIQFYTSAICDPSGHGEGQTQQGEVFVTTDATGNASFGPRTQFDARAFLTATATDPSGNTSEFSQCVAFVVPGTPTVVPAQTPTPDPGSGAGRGPASPIPTLFPAGLLLMGVALALASTLLIRTR